MKNNYKLIILIVISYCTLFSVKNVYSELTSYEYLLTITKQNEQMLINSKEHVTGYQRNEILYDPYDIKYKVRELKEKAERMMELIRRQEEAKRFHKNDGSQLAKEVKNKVKMLNYKMKDLESRK